MIRQLKKFRVENQKYRHLYVPLIFLLFVCMDMGIVFMTAFDSSFQSTMNQADGFAWLQLMDSYVLAKLLFTPILLADVTSRVVDIENTGDMWKILKTSGWTMGEIFDIKFLSIFIKYIIFQLLEWIAFMMVGKKVGISIPIPVERFTITFISMIAISFAIMNIHYFLAMRYENQLIGLAFGVGGSLFGVIGAFLPLSISRFIPYSYYAHLRATDYVKVGESEWVLKVVPQRIYPLIISLLLGIVVYLSSRRKIETLDF